MREKLKYIDWKQYFKFVGIYCGIILFAKLSPSKDNALSWEFALGFSIFIILFFLLKALLDVTIYLNSQKRLYRTKSQILMDNRKKKLKKLNSKWLKMKLQFAKKKKTQILFP